MEEKLLGYEKHLVWIIEKSKELPTTKPDKIRVLLSKETGLEVTDEDVTLTLKSLMKKDLINIEESTTKHKPVYVLTDKGINCVALLNKENNEKDKEIDINDILEKAKESHFSGSCRLSGIVGNGTFYHTVFLNVNGSYTPIVVTDKKEFVKVENDDNGYFFKYGEEVYRYYSDLAFNPNWDIFTIDNSIIDLIKNPNVSKTLYDEIRSLIFECWDINEEFEYDVHSTFPILTYVQDLLGKTLYLILIGKEDTGKSTEQRVLSRLSYNGTFKGKGTSAVCPRLVHLLEVSLSIDEFEKLSKDELTVFQGVLNNGFYIDGCYWYTNINKKKISEQIQLLKNFSFKSFSLNELGNRFESNFLSRCHITVCVHQIRKTLDLLKPSKEIEQRFQTLRNKIFVYCLLNWKSIIEDIEFIEKELEKEEVFGRKRDIYSIILGIYKHFKGDHSLLRKYLEDKESLGESKITDTEESILNLIVERFTEQSTVEISNEDIKDRVYQDLGITEDSKFKPTPKSIGRHLVRLKLIRKKEDKVRKGSRGNFVYKFNKEVIKDVLLRLNLRDLIERIPSGIEKQKILTAENQRSETSETSEHSVTTIQ
jgi:hypothetical protein